MEKNPVPPPYYPGPAANPGYPGYDATSPPYAGLQVPNAPPSTQYVMNQYGMNQYGMDGPAQVVPNASPSTQYGVNQYGMIEPAQVAAVVVQPAYTDVPAQVNCPHCQSYVMTETRYQNGVWTWILFWCLFLFLCWPCSFIPFCVDSCKDVEHTCPNCRRVLHRHKQM